MAAPAKVEETGPSPICLVRAHGRTERKQKIAAVNRNERQRAGDGFLLRAPLNEGTKVEMDHVFSGRSHVREQIIDSRYSKADSWTLATVTTVSPNGAFGGQESQ